VDGLIGKEVFAFILKQIVTVVLLNIVDTIPHEHLPPRHAAVLEKCKIF